MKRFLLPLLGLLACDKRSAPAPAAAPASALVAASASAVLVAPSAPIDAGAPAPAHVDYNVVVLSVDSLRADMPWAGYPRAIAPRLTELETRSVSYTRAYSISSYTSMSLGGLLGGKLPSEMKRNGFFFGKYADDNLMFPELLKQKGIRTMAAHAHSYF